jgi:hypothetical protein
MRQTFALLLHQFGVGCPLGVAMPRLGVQGARRPLTPRRVGDNNGILAAGMIKARLLPPAA